ncbi:MAG: hypothetical protein EZS28_044396 [Streblomastix strix]|uniref:Uncharacterized protein n=1 Tax=Streblomastix strix TaxID=222440 RepID=A0A5J4TPC3_9EUKA|nr:MAG: hypothetical protein EZS28_044396 [Streblomastix strix]
MFLQYYRKNWVKAQSAFKLSRSSSINSIKISIELWHKLKNIIKQLNQECKTSGIRINFGLIYKQLKIIVESEVKSRKRFEVLMVMQPHNTAVLRNYAKPLLDIYYDEDTAEMILLQADMIDQISTQNTTNAEAQNEPDPVSQDKSNYKQSSQNAIYDQLWIDEIKDGVKMKVPKKSAKE